jgi:hypothetical protein
MKSVLPAVFWSTDAVPTLTAPWGERQSARGEHVWLGRGFLQAVLEIPVLGKGWTRAIARRQVQGPCSLPKGDMHDPAQFGARASWKRQCMRVAGRECAAQVEERAVVTRQFLSLWTEHAERLVSLTMDAEAAEPQRALTCMKASQLFELDPAVMLEGQHGRWCAADAKPNPRMGLL